MRYSSYIVLIFIFRVRFIMPSEFDAEKTKTEIISSVTKVAKKRVLVAFSLSAFLLILYAIYGLLLGASSEIAGHLVIGKLNLVVLLSVIAIVAGVLGAGIYTWWANKKYDPLLDQLRKDYENV